MKAAHRAAARNPRFRPLPRHTMQRILSAIKAYLFRPSVASLQRQVLEARAANRARQQKGAE